MTCMAKTCFLIACEAPASYEVKGYWLCSEHASDAYKIMVKTVFGIGPTEMFPMLPARGGDDTDA